MKIESLTKEQEKQVEQYYHKYVDKFYAGQDEFDKEAVERSIKFLYKLSDLDELKEIIYCDGPTEMRQEAGLKDGESFDYNGFGYDAGWTAFYDCMEEVVGVKYDDDMYFGEWKEFIHSGVFATVLYENIAYVCRNPRIVNVNENGDLHCENGVAIEWRDGTREFALNGVFVTEYIVMTPANEIDCDLILKEKNAEVRKEIINKVGIKNVIKSLGAKSIEKRTDQIPRKIKYLMGLVEKEIIVDVEYELLNFDRLDGRYRPYLKMTNPSTGSYHVEGVHPDCKTINEALAWRNGMKEYTPPIVLT